jgi:hypothetical protein
MMTWIPSVGVTNTQVIGLSVRAVNFTMRNTLPGFSLGEGFVEIGANFRHPRNDSGI